MYPILKEAIKLSSVMNYERKRVNDDAVNDSFFVEINVKKMSEYSIERALNVFKSLWHWIKNILKVMIFLIARIELASNCSKILKIFP